MSEGKRGLSGALRVSVDKKQKKPELKRVIWSTKRVQKKRGGKKTNRTIFEFLI